MSTLVVATACAACNPASVADDPIRVEFIAACEGRIEYRSMKPKHRTAYCECGYDETMARLSIEEKPFAQFYLLEQVGAIAQSKTLTFQPNMEAMLKASNAIGRAAARCR